MHTWPEYAYEALSRRDYPSAMADDVLGAFATHWGGVDEHAVVRAVKVGHGDERILAMWMLSLGRLPAAGDALAAVLEVESRPERWNAAHCLGELADTRAVPALAAMLLESWPSAHAYMTADLETSLLEMKRMAAANLLADLASPTYAPMLHEALQAATRLEAELFDKYAQSSITLQMYQYMLVYALGRMGALGALTDIDLTGVRNSNGEEDPTSRLDLWRAHLLMGYLHSHDEMPTAYTHSEEMARLRERLESLLAQIFGLSEPERQRCMRWYAGMLIRTVQEYQRAQGTSN